MITKKAKQTKMMRLLMSTESMNMTVKGWLTQKKPCLTSTLSLFSSKTNSETTEMMPHHPSATVASSAIESHPFTHHTQELHLPTCLEKARKANELAQPINFTLSTFHWDFSLTDH